uniref:Uncharacterized protein n=1 Tax=Arundo donax TaxID=35708 RepID=A0A0A9B3R9_ARUDO
MFDSYKLLLNQYVLFVLHLELASHLVILFVFAIFITFSQFSSIKLTS